MSTLGRVNRLTFTVHGVLAISACVVTLGAASAAEPQRGALASCATDLATFCPGIEAGGGKKMQCLMQNQSRLSAACATSVQARVAARAARLGGNDPVQLQTSPPPPAGQSQTIAPPASAATPVQGPMRACKSDVATLCATVEAGGGRKVKCLIENHAKLSPACAAAIVGVQSQRQSAKAACVADVASLCAGAKGPARMQCLEANKAKLSPACAERVDLRLVQQAKRASVAPAAPKP